MQTQGLTPVQKATVAAAVAAGAGFTVAKALGDFFLTRPERKDDRDTLAGMASFALAYATLGAALWRGRPTPSDATVTAGVVAWSSGVAALVWPHVASQMRPAVIGFSACIGAMAIAAGTTPGRGWFSPAVARRAAAAAAILLASDSLVGLNLFHPRWRAPSVARDLAVRLTYLAGWALMLLVVQQPAAGLRRNVGGP